MRTIQKKANVKNKLLDFETMTKTAVPLVQGIQRFYFYSTVKDGILFVKRFLSTAPPHTSQTPASGSHLTDSAAPVFSEFLR